jgi:hypothetical protein
MGLGGCYFICSNLFAAIFFADKDSFEYPKQESADGG